MKKSDVKQLKVNNRFTFYNLLSDKDYRLILLALIIIPLLIFWRAMRYEFVWDDIDIHIIDNPYLNPPTAANIAHLWTNIYEGLYIPVAHTLWALIKLLSSWLGLKPDDTLLYHLANLILHIFNGMLVFTLLKQFIQNKWAVFAGTLLFLIHPVQVEPVVWISEFRGLLAFFFGFSAMLLYLESCQLKKNAAKVKKVWMYDAASFLLFIIALLSKPSAVIFPLFLGILEYTLYRSTLKQIITRLWPWILPVIAATLITTSAQNNYQSFILWSRPAIFLDTISFYLYKIVVPVWLMGCYALDPDYLLTQWWFYVIWIVPLLVIAALWRYRKRQPLLIVAFLLFVVGFLPVSGLLRFMYQDWSTVADRYLYISVFGASLAFAVLADWCVVYKKQWIVLLPVVLIWASITGIVQIPVWKNPVTFWSHIIDLAPPEARAYYNRGLSYVRQNKDEQAIGDFNKAINLGFKEAFNNRGGVYLRNGKYQQAIDDLNQAVSYYPENEKAWYNRGFAYLKLKKYDVSIADFDQALKLNPEYQKALYSRQIAVTQMMSLKSKQDVINRAAINQEQNFYNLGNSLAEQGKYTLAIHYYSQAIGQNPDQQEAYINRGNCYSALKDYSKAIQDYKKVLKLNPASVIILNNLATSYFFLGDNEKACEYWKKGKELNDKESTDAYRLHCR